MHNNLGPARALLTASNAGSGELSVLRLEVGEEKGRAMAVGGKRLVGKPEGEPEDAEEYVSSPATSSSRAAPSSASASTEP